MRVSIDRDSDVVAARQKGRELASQCGFPSTDLAVVATAISELARNIVRYAVRGEIILRLVQNDGKKGIEVVANDERSRALPDLGASGDVFTCSGTFGIRGASAGAKEPAPSAAAEAPEETAVPAASGEEG